jgi:hypothetical protein
LSRLFLAAITALSVVVGGTAAPRAQTAAAVTQIAASLQVLVLFADGVVAALGNNRSGQATGPQDLRGFVAARRVSLPIKAVQIAAGGDTSYAVLENGRVMAWGRGYERELGVMLEGTTFRTTPDYVPGLTNIKEIVASEHSALAVTRDGEVWAWGDQPARFVGSAAQSPGLEKPVRVAGLTGIETVVGSGADGFALTRDGRVFAWGYNERGRLGTDVALDDALPPTELTAIRDVVSIATTSGAVAAVKRDGTVWVWGSNTQGGLGNGMVSDMPARVPEALKGITGAAVVRAGTYGRHFIVRRTDGSLIGWGNTDWGQLGAGLSGRHQPTPTAIKLPAVEGHWLGGNFSFARTKDGGIWFWGERDGAAGLLGVNAQQKIPALVAPEKLRPAP